MERESKAIADSMQDKGSITPEQLVNQKFPSILGE